MSAESPFFAGPHERALFEQRPAEPQRCEVVQGATQSRCIGIEGHRGPHEYRPLTSGDSRDEA